MGPLGTCVSTSSAGAMQIAEGVVGATCPIDNEVAAPAALGANSGIAASDPMAARLRTRGVPAAR